MSHTGLPEEPAPLRVSEKKQLSHDAYTVGWICVLQCELNAAKALLDEQHEQLPSAAKDDNSYLLGRMAGHNVVIAFTGLGTYGTNAAAQTAVHMVRTFPNIRFGLLAGVGSGAPNRPDQDDPFNDLRLGDVVKNDAEFSIESHLNKPPKVLSKAIELLQSEHDFGEGHMLHYIHQVALKAAKLRGLRQYRFPGRDKDQLFNPNYPHASESDCSACDPAQLVERLSRDSDDPIIHYGLIASGNAVLRSAKRRDELRDAWGVLCFEMEAAGLMDNFPCIPYSAVVAAAYAKDLLRVIRPQEIDKLEAITKALEKFLEDFATTGEAVTRIESKITSEEDIRTLEWLTPVNYGLQQSDYFQRRQRETGQWFLNSSQFQEWLQTSQQTLFCQGIPGAGKTILTSIVINDLYTRFDQDSTIGIAYIYCNFQRTDDQQLSAQQQSLPSSVKTLYNSHRAKHTRPSLEEIRGALQSVARMYTRVFLVIFALQHATKANFFETSRHIQGIRNQFDESILLDIRAREDDIRQYLEERISGLPSFILKRSDLQKRIVQQIANSTDGMFLLAKLHLDSLQHQPTPKAVLKVLDNLPKGDESLNQTYDETMKRIKNQGLGFQQLALQALSWISCATRQLSTLELQTALAIEKDSCEIDEDNIPEISDIVSACAGLVTVDKKSDIVRLVHYTAQDYFQRTQKDWFPDAQTEITSTCITYLSFHIFNTGVCPTYEAIRERMRRNPLYSYAAEKRGYHAQNADNPNLDINTLFESQLAMEAAWQVCEMSGKILMQPLRASRVTGLHLAAFFGLQDLAEKLIYKYGPNPLTDSMETPLSLAVKTGYEAIVKLLLENGADVDSKDAFDRTPLIKAPINGHEAIFQLLLKRGADFDSKDKDGWTALIYAAVHGHEAIVELLLENEADLESKNEDGRTALIHAAISGWEGVVKLLLENGADLDIRDIYNRTAFIYAVISGHEAIAKLLLQNGADANLKNEYDRTLLLENGAHLEAKDKNGWTALFYAVEHGYEAAAKLLLENGADLELKDEDGRPAFFYAVRNSHEAIVQLLLDNGADLWLVDEYNWSPLDLVVIRGLKAINKLPAGKSLGSKRSVPEMETYRERVSSFSSWDGFE
ncbi:ankyrin repeat protein [Trichoderma pleuroticola]